MADRTQLKIADRDQLAENDPFAELTRMMGFDPRVPVQPQGEARTEPLADDFAIDLEKELMGEFGDEPALEAGYPPVGEPVPEPYAGGEPAQDFHAQDFRSDEFTHDQPSAIAGQEPSAADLPADEHVDFSDFEMVLASELPDAADADHAAFSEAEPPFEAAFDGTAEGEEFPAFDDADFVFEEPEAVAAERDEPAEIELYDDGDDFERALAASMSGQQPAEDADADDRAPRAESREGADAGAYHAHMPAPQAPAASLEDELNTLLNQMSAGSPVAEEPHFDLEEPLAIHVETDGSGPHEAPADPQDFQASSGDFDLDIDLAGFDSGMHAHEQGADDPVASPAATPFVPAAATVAATAATAHGWGRGTPYIPSHAGVTSSMPVTAAASHCEPDEIAGAGQDFGTDDRMGVETPAPSAEMPELETIEIPEKATVVADDLDIPHVAFDEDQTEAAVYDDMDAEFAGLLNELGAGAPASAQGLPPQPASYQAFGREAQGQTAPGPTDAYGPAYDDFEMDAAAQTYAAQPYASQAPADDGFDYDPDEDQTMAAIGEREEPRPRNRLLMAAAAVGAVALLGGLGAFALSFGGGDTGGAPVLVEADEAPIKVKPENPGGTVIPNQDNKVYDMVARGDKPAAPTQEKLVSDTEQPIDVTARTSAANVGDMLENDTAAVAGKSEDRIAPAPAEENVGANDVPVVAPRKVRTMIVKADGTLVPHESPAVVQQVAATEPLDPAPEPVSAPGSEKTAALAPAASAPPPAAQPVDVAVKAAPEKAVVAALDPNAAAAGSWAMQIASQPSAEAAQSTYDDLARRYAGVLQGRGVSIVKAEVAGKGTFYRVRVAASSRNEAINLCESYKAAGGACFVSK